MGQRLAAFWRGFLSAYYSDKLAIIRSAVILPLALITAYYRPELWLFSVLIAVTGVGWLALVMLMPRKYRP